ncbi:glycosyltransferase family 69 protein [Cenococcum geophilum 1.58]|uniref:glycosyltransferase family 69 protein n=1 Tax=Cenococcum geophilum 1.58 TaxID=794803 RepID=UPI00358FC8AB|nr:glycosyltransferase family 69 protein [Cenococcum geophilum 1.58]
MAAYEMTYRSSDVETLTPNFRDRQVQTFGKPRASALHYHFDLGNLWARSWRASDRGPFGLLSLLNGLLQPSYMHPPTHYGDLEKDVVESNRNGRGNPNNEKVFIAANIINEELIRGSWGVSLLELVGILGKENVFVSIYENDSGDGTRDALLKLEKELPCNSSVVAGDHIALSKFPPVVLPSGQMRTKRLTYLAEVRNRAILPLSQGPEIDQWVQKHPEFKQATGHFDRILFLNDVYFKPIEAVQLLFSTNMGPSGRAEYSAACAIDFVAKNFFYDSFVVRDMEGYGMGLNFYPWFQASGNAQSRNDILSQTDAVRVRSCWGGMAAFNASIFQPHVGSHNVTIPALRFRSSPEPFWEAAECCLLFADAEVRRSILREQDAGVFVNPFIRVAYSQATWDWLPFWRRYERIFQFVQYFVSKIGYPEHNPRRTHAAGSLVQEKVWIPNEHAKQWGSFEIVNRIADAGGFCGQRRMFVMKDDLEKANSNGWEKNWEVVKVPSG